MVYLATEPMKYAVEELSRYIRLITKCEVVPETVYTEGVPKLIQGRGDTAKYAILKLFCLLRYSLWQILRKK